METAISLALDAAAGAVRMADAGPSRQRRRRRCDAIATAKKGEQLLDHGARAFCELLSEVDKFDVKGLLDSSGPSR